MIGNDLLLDLGIDVNDQMQELAGQEFDLDPSQDDLEVDGLEACFIQSVEDECQVVRDHLQVMIDLAKSNGLPREWTSRFESLVWEYQDIFAVRLGEGGPARVPPFKVELKDNVTSKRIPQRNYPPLHRDFLKYKFEIMLQHRIASINSILPISKRIFD